MTERLERVRRAGELEQQAHAAKLAAIAAARDAGATFPELAAALGVSRQAVRQLVLRNTSRKTRAPGT